MNIHVAEILLLDI